jgi:hypothetical protein
MILIVFRKINVFDMLFLNRRDKTCSRSVLRQLEEKWIRFGYSNERPKVERKTNDAAGLQR